MKLLSNVTYLDKTFSRNQICKFMLSSVETLVVHESCIQNVCLKINMSSVVKYGSFLVLVYFEDWQLLICGFSEFFILTLYFFRRISPMRNSVKCLQCQEKSFTSCQPGNKCLARKKFCCFRYGLFPHHLFWMSQLLCCILYKEQVSIDCRK